MSFKTRPGLHAVKTTGQQGLRQLNSLSLGLGSTMKVTLFIVKTLQKHRPMPSLNALSRSCSTLMVAALAAVFTQLSLAQASNPDLKDPPPSISRATTDPRDLTSPGAICRWRPVKICSSP